MVCIKGRVFFTSIYLQHQAERERLAKVELARVDGLRRVLPAHLWNTVSFLGF
jgi:hypothetical protein